MWPAHTAEPSSGRVLEDERGHVSGTIPTSAFLLIIRIPWHLWDCYAYPGYSVCVCTRVGLVQGSSLGPRLSAIYSHTVYSETA